jgi:SGNH domain (fused to AT3 domains)
VILALLALVLLTGTADAKPRCYGAASRDAAKPCHNPRLDRSVRPTPEQATITPNVACTPVDGQGCAFGAGSETVVVLGDSHASHWRAGMEVVARRRGWRVLEFARPHCPFSFSTPAATEAGASECVAYNQDTIAWLTANPSVTTVFVSNNARLPMAEKGIDARIKGDSDALRALPASVQHVYVLRDPPTDRVSSHDCVDRALRRKTTFARCAVPRKRALVRDPTVEAALRLGRTVIDLTPFFCSRAKCFPVVGGVLTHKDQDHLTQDFARTLGPYIDAKL